MMDEYEAAALRDVNKVRKVLGLEPITKLRRGVPGVAEMCPLARSVRAGYSRVMKELNVQADVSSIYEHDKDGRITREWPNSDKTRCFVGDFDNDHYPHLKMWQKPAS